MTRWPSWTTATSSARDPISDLLAGASLALQVECSDPDRARSLLDATTIGAEMAVEPGRARDHPAGRAPARDVIAEINRVLVEGSISVYRLQEIQASLESWFLSVTSRLGADAMTTCPRHPLAGAGADGARRPGPPGFVDPDRRP